jgi:MFS superfamily sulfate permease-like transporter
VSLLVGDTVRRLQSKYCPPQGFNQTLNDINRHNSLVYIDSSQFLSMEPDQARVLIAMSQTLWVGVIHFFMGIFRLGFLATYLSEPLIIGFTAASAVLASVSQLKYIFGVQIEAQTGLFKVIKVSRV